MAYCTSCGAQLREGDAVCPNCGAVSPQGAGSTSGTISAAPEPPRKGGILKWVLIALGIVLLVGVLIVAAVVWIGLEFAERARISQTEEGTVIETPLGRVETRQGRDPRELAEEMGVEVYPEATADAGSGVDMQVAGIEATTAVFKTGDPPSKVADWYREKYPEAGVVLNEDGAIITIPREQEQLMIITSREGDHTQIVISRAKR